MLIVGVLFATVLLRVAIVAAVVYLLLPKGVSCPRCSERLTPIRHPLLKLLVPPVEHRWCLACGWSGIVVPQSRVINRAARS
jgi:hypothetical protein